MDLKDESKPTPTEVRTAAPPAAAEPTAAAASASALDAVFEDWIAAQRGGAIARHTPAWNALVAALPALKKAIIEKGV